MRAKNYWRSRRCWWAFAKKLALTTAKKLMKKLCAKIKVYKFTIIIVWYFYLLFSNLSLLKIFNNKKRISRVVVVPILLQLNTSCTNRVHAIIKNLLLWKITIILLIKLREKLKDFLKIKKNNFQLYNKIAII